MDKLPKKPKIRKRKKPHIPTKVSAYCASPRLEMKSAHCSADHWVINPRGEPPLPPECVNVVGVFSADGDSESVGEDDSNPAAKGPLGEGASLRS